MKTIVLVGKRAAAREAVEALGFNAVVIDMSRRPEQAAHAFGGTLQEVHAWSVDQLGDVQPAAVIGVAEGSVPAAAALRERLNLPGISTKAAHLAHDKLEMKRAIVRAGVLCAPWAAVKASTTADELFDQLGCPVVLKVPVSSGGRGVRIYHEPRELAAALVPGLLAEGFVNGTEMSVESFMLGNRPLLRNHTRYLRQGRASIVPAGLAEASAEAVNALADSVHGALGLGEGITHMEIFLTADGPVFSEIAARPPGGRLMNLLALTYHFNPWEALVRISLGEDPGIPTTHDGFAGAYLLYPDPGRIQAIHGLREAAELPGVIEVKCHAKVGDDVEPRLGTGQIKGHILTSHESMAGCEAQLLGAYATIRFDMCSAFP